MPHFTWSPIQPEDRDALYAIMQDSKVRQSYGLFSERHFNKAAVTGFCTLAQSFNQANKAMLCVIKNAGETIGYIGAAETDPERRPGQWEIGYFLDSKYQGQGIVSGLTPGFLEDVRRKYGVENFFTFVKSDNTGSERILEKNGFVRVGMVNDWTPLIITEEGQAEPDQVEKRSMDVFELKHSLS